MKVTSKHVQASENLFGEPGANPSRARRGYLAAVERIEKHATDPDNVYWLAPHDEAQYVVGYGLVVGPDCTPISPDEAREWAYELLVLADLAERQERDDD